MQFRTTLFLLVAFGALLPIGLQGQSTSGTLSLDSLLSIRISTAARYEQTAQEAAASISVVTREDIERFGYRSVGEVLAMLDGFYLTDDLTFLYMGVRGFGRPSDNNNRVLLLIDGQRWNDLFNGEAGVDARFAVPIEAVERIEVVRGPGSALYGSSAMLAVVNVITGHGQDAGVRASAEAASDIRRGTVTFAARAGADISLSGFASWFEQEQGDLYFPEFDNPVTNGGVVPAGRLSGASSFGVSAEAKGLRLNLRMNDGDLTDPTAPYQSSFGTGESTRISEKRSVELQYLGSMSPKVAVEANLFGRETAMDGRVAYDAPIPDRLINLDGSQWGGGVDFTIDPNAGLRIKVGAEYRRDAPDVRVGMEQAMTHGGEPINVGSAFVLNELQLLASLSIVAGVRADYYSIAGSALSPRGAVVFHPAEGATLKLLYGEAFRAPTPLEQFIHEPPFLKANGDLAPERIRTSELIWEQRITEGLQVSASLYDYRMRDLIAQAQDPADGILTYMNVDRIRGVGGSAGILGRFDNLTFFANASWQDVVDENTDVELANSPGVLFRAGGTATLPGGFNLGGTVLHDSSRRTARGDLTEGYTLVNLSLGGPRLGSLSTALHLRNASDVGYWHPAGLEHRQASMPQAGRSISLVISAGF